MPETVPVNVGLFNGAFAANEFVTVVANDASPPRASDNSFRVSNVAGAEFTKLDIAVFVYILAADCAAAADPDGS